MTAFQEAMLLRIRCHMEELVSRREGLIADNAAWIQAGSPPPHQKSAFDDIANALAAIAPDPHGFSS